MTHQTRTDRGLYWDRAWTLVQGCTKVSTGCTHCWAERESAMRKHNPLVAEHHEGLTDEAGHWTGAIRTRRDNLLAPRRATKSWTWSVWNDLFHRNVPMPFFAQVMDTMAVAAGQTFLVLTKRPERIAPMIEEMMGNWPEGCPANSYLYAHTYLPNVWWGTTVENQSVLIDRMTELLKVPGHHFLSVEPMLSHVDLTPYLWRCECGARPFDDGMQHWRFDGARWQHYHGYPIGHVDCEPSGAIDWVVAGPETGAQRRHIDLSAFHNLAWQCRVAGVPLFIKKLESDGTPTADMSRWPDDLRIRQYPAGV